MKMHARLIQLIALVLCGLLVFAATRLSPSIDAGRAELHAFGTEDVYENVPPEYAFAVQAFGAFRSLIVNIAFIRAETLKEQGRYYDAMQLASWICKLQPRFPSVWAFHAWNMAWNISVTTYTPEERWNWVYNGVRLLRDEGIPMNPRAVTLYKELAWIFNNKMSENLDDFHWDYKRAWAWRMHLLLGPPPSVVRGPLPDEGPPEILVDVSEDPLNEVARAIAAENEAIRRRRAQEEQVPYRTSKPLEERLREMETELEAEVGQTEAQLAKLAAYDFIRAIADAPRSLPELYAAYPETREMVAALRELGVIITDDELDEDHYWYEGRLAERFFARYRRLVDTPSLLETIRKDAEPSPDREELERFDRIVGAREHRPAGEALLRFLQSKVLREVYKLDPDHMAYVVKNFGPVDWRAVDAHSLYWVTLGLIRGGETPSDFQVDRVNTARLIFFSLRNLFERNRITFEPHPENIFKSYISFARDLNFVEPMHRAFITYGPLIDPDPGDVTGAGDVFRTGHINFLTEAIQALYFAGRTAEAAYYYKYLRTHYGIRRYTNDLEKRFTLPLRDFVITTLYGDIESQRQTMGVISDLLWRAYDELANGQVSSYNQYVSKALELHRVYMEEKGAYRGPRMKLPPFQDMQVDVFRQWFMMPPTSPYVTIRKAEMWRVAPLGLKQWVYDDLRPGFELECNAWNFDVDKAFPEPPGMDKFRQEHPRREVQRRKPTAETPAQAPGD